MPQQQKAVVLEAKFGPVVLKEIDVPKAGAGQVVLRVEATALNPGDWKVVDQGIIVQKYPLVLGFDAAGVIVEVGEGVEGFSLGDRVITQGWLESMDGQVHGTFQQYALAPTTCIAKIPSNISFEEAATIPSGLATAALPLYNQTDGVASAKLLPAWEESGRGKYAGKAIFILGGASSIGQYVIQLARMSGFTFIITTASLHNTDLLKGLGATHVLDRKLLSETLVQQVNEIAGGPASVVYDAISTTDTLSTAYQATAPGGDLVVVLHTPVPGAEENVKKIHIAFGVFHIPTNFALAKSLLSKLPELLESGEIKPNRAEILPGGLRAVTAGLDRLRNNQVSAAKLVVRPFETDA
ncbi:GroES-like protein [Cubamyces menziesii]|uniref:Enoyl reductase (ER) domain-containing protein n=1 Tax=Trametes cubensis TaxID=1111947 RepID=A0AAD7XED3_9APHY|nr:GroES-like protein [Cubamyces menziesii]KAJ8489397.1 hypothetical protein ONZ51_g2956 [Trametes cubensis]